MWVITDTDESTGETKKYSARSLQLGIKKAIADVDDVRLIDFECGHVSGTNDGHPFPVTVYYTSPKIAHGVLVQERLLFAQKVR